MKKNFQNNNKKKAFSVASVISSLAAVSLIIVAVLSGSKIIGKAENLSNDLKTNSDYLTYTNSGQSSQSFEADCQGGVIESSSVNGYIVHIFKSNDSFSCESAKTVEYLVVGGGGGSNSGGGGAGGILDGEIDIQANFEYQVTIGLGGQGTNHGHVSASNGGNSIFANLIAYGGGGGGAQGKGNDGGSGGGNGHCNGGAWPRCSGSPSSGFSGQGNNGGMGRSGGGNGTGTGGGGGAGGVGGSAFIPTGDGCNSESRKGGAGGIGIQSDIDGVLKWYGVGGPGTHGGCCSGTCLGTGDAAPGGSAVNQDGEDNTGNGAGAGSKNGGSGIVIIRYRVS